MRHLKTFKQLNESITADDIVTSEIARINVDGEDLMIMLHHSPKDLFYNMMEAIDMEDGEVYTDISTTLPNNDLTSAIWVKQGGVEERIADALVDVDKLVKTSAITESGFNKYIKYDFSADIEQKLYHG